MTFPMTHPLSPLTTTRFPGMPTLASPAYVCLALAAYACLRRCVGLADVALLGLLALGALAYGLYTGVVARTAASPDVSSPTSAGPHLSSSRSTSRSGAVVPTPPPALGQTVVPHRPATATGRGTVHPPPAFARAIRAYPELRNAWQQLDRVYAHEGPVPLGQRSALQAARDAFVEHVRALRRLARQAANAEAPPSHAQRCRGGRVSDPRRRLELPGPRRRHPPRPLSEAQRRATVVTTYARLQDAFDGLRLQVMPLTSAGRRAEAAMDRIGTALEAVDTGDAYSARVPAPVNGRV